MSSKHISSIDEAASAWLIRRDSGAWTEEDQADFEQWVNGSLLNRVAYLRLEAVWEEAARLKALGAGIAGDSPPERGRLNLSPFYEAPAAHEPAPSEPTPDRGRRQRFAGAASAAALIAGIGLAAVLISSRNGSREYHTAVGRITDIALDDGSRLTLNTDSELRVAFTAGQRSVQLERGEAFFQVAKDPQRPFVVNVNGKRVIAVGTQFSVRREPNEAEVVVTEGRVQVVADGTTLLTPGSVAHAGDSGVLVQHQNLAEAEEHLSWRTGILTFRDRSLADAAAEFNRYNDRKIVIRDPSLAALRIEGNFRATNVEAFVRLLENAFPVHADFEADTIEIH